MLASRLARPLPHAAHTRHLFRHPPRRCIALLGLESSADDSCAAVVTEEGRVLSNVVIKQNAELTENGGIHPYTAMHAHQRNMPTAIRRALDEAGMKITDVDGIAFTRGPGMPGSLSVCATSARALGAALDKPIIGVHHMQAHALTALLPSLYAAPDAPVTAATPLRGSPPAFPFLTLLISGGHTLLLLATGPDAFRTLASTQDQAIGNAFDRSARLLGLAPGAHGFGSALEAFVADDAADGCDQGAGWAFAADAPRGPPEDAPAPDVPTFTVPLPRMMMFSYSGPHSAVDRYLRDRGGLENVGVRTRRAVAREFQRVAVAHLEEKVVRGLQMLREEGLEVRDVVVSGGVASNTYLRRQLQSSLETAFAEDAPRLVFPPVHLCTDNAVMIAWAAMHRFARQDFDPPHDVLTKAKWTLDEFSASYAGGAQQRLGDGDAEARSGS